MNIKTLEISLSCKLNLYEYNRRSLELELEYIEESSDPWYGDTRIYVGIDKNKAKEIISLLQEYIGEV